MQFHLRVFLQKELHPFGLVGRKVIHDHVNFPLLGLTTDQLGKERHKLGTGMSGGGLAQDLTGLRVQGRIQGERSMTKVFKAMTLGAAGRQWQNRIQPIQRLNRRLLSSFNAGNAKMSGPSCYRWFDSDPRLQRLT